MVQPTRRQDPVPQAQVELLRARIPGDRVILAPEERSRLMKIGAEMGHRVHDLLGIVTVKTYQRWRREQAASRAPGRVGRPRKVTASIRALILRLAKESTGWGARRIVGELKKLALPISRGTVRRVLTDEGILPDPERHAPRGVVTPWRTFVRAHANVIVATDFFCKTVWTPLGKRVAYGLVFIHLGSRKVFVSPGTYHPDEAWVLQQARNMTMWLEDEGLEMRFLLRDRDTKYSAALDRLIESAGARQSYVQAYAGYYNRYRPHQGLGNVPLGREDAPMPIRPPTEVGLVRRHAYMGGLLSYYERKAA